MEQSTVLLFGLHPLKHALRFGAEVVWVKTKDKATLMTLAQEYASDVVETIEKLALEVSEKEFLELSPHMSAYAKECDVIAKVQKPKESQLDVAALVARIQKGWQKGGQQAPYIFLENPTHLGNIGACIRVSAAAGAAGVITSGTLNPWHPLALKGSQGLHFALPVVHVKTLPDHLTLPLIAFSDEGEVWKPSETPLPAIFAFGSERKGLLPETKKRAEKVVALPMQAHVSSLNLATAVSAALYVLHYNRGGN